jgi:phosphatidylglycerophosphate synthase
LFIVAGGIFDFIDGKVAALTGKTSKWGAILDSTLDRYSDVVLYLAIAAYYLKTEFPVTAFVALMALVGSMMTSYLMAIGRSHGYEFRIGILRRQDRLTLIGAGVLLTFLHEPIAGLLVGIAEYLGISPGPLPIMPLTLIVYFLAILANFTAVQRLIFLRVLSTRSGDDDLSPQIQDEASLKEKQMKTLSEKVVKSPDGSE